MSRSNSNARSNPYTIHQDEAPEEAEYHAFWADEIADQIEAREPGDPIVIKGGVSPSGVPHIGHFNEIMRGYYVAEVLRERGHEVRQIFTNDDKDRLRKVPRLLATLDWELVELADMEGAALAEHLGEPYTDVPDPFECCESYGEHFSNLLAQSAELIGVPVEFVSNTDLYAEGKFEALTRHVLEDRENAREVLAKYQNKVDEDYVPFVPQCANCGKLTEGVTGIDLEAGTVEYVCRDQTVGNATLKGCGHEGTATLREGKLPWRFEWPAQWKILGVDFEPFGKDHAEGSWPSGEDIARNVFGFEPPVPMVYEWFTLDGAALSSSSGNVITVAEVLEVLEPEVLRYFFVKDPSKARDFAVEHFDRLVGEFDRFEAVYFGEVDAEDHDRRLAERAYPLVVDEIREERIRIPYSFAALVGMTEDERVRRDILERSRFVTEETPDFAVEHFDRLVGEFDRFEAVYFGEVDAEDHDRRLAERAYPLVVDEIREERIRIPYSFAALVGMTEDERVRRDILERSRFVTEETPEWAVEDALDRVRRARAWAERVDNEYNVSVKRNRIPDVDFDAETESALSELADFIEAGHGPEEIQGEIYETAKRHDLGIGEFFSAGYRLFLDEPQGPKLGPFLAALDREFVLARLRHER